MSPSLLTPIAWAHHCSPAQPCVHEPASAGGRVCSRPGMPHCLLADDRACMSLPLLVAVFASILACRIVCEQPCLHEPASAGGRVCVRYSWTRLLATTASCKHCYLQAMRHARTAAYKHSLHAHVPTFVHVCNQLPMPLSPHARSM